MAQYDPKTLRKLQLCELEILKDFVKICEENNLKYFGFAGTAIGAIRHGGFIPWDDDIDMGILREDYEKLREIIQRDYADKYTFVDAHTYNDYANMNAHIVLNGTKFTESTAKNCKYPQGIFLDIFPFDHAPADEVTREKFVRKVWLASKFLIVKHTPFPVLPFKKGIKVKLCHAVTAVIWFFLNLFCISHKFLYKKLLKFSTKYNKEDTGYYYYSCSSSRQGTVYAKEDFYPFKKIKFEDVDLDFPQNIEKALGRVYGDFMQLPPEEKRVNHCPDELVFPKENE